jgi:hypothetical protein
MVLATESKAEKFARRIRERHLINPMSLDFAQRIVAKYTGFHRGGVNFQGHDSRIPESSGGLEWIRQANHENVYLNVTRAGNMIQRRAFSSGRSAMEALSAREESSGETFSNGGETVDSSWRLRRAPRAHPRGIQAREYDSSANSFVGRRRPTLDLSSIVDDDATLSRKAAMGKAFNAAFSVSPKSLSMPAPTLATTGAGVSHVDALSPMRKFSGEETAPFQSREYGRSASGSNLVTLSADPGKTPPFEFKALYLAAAHRLLPISIPKTPMVHAVKSGSANTVTANNFINSRLPTLKSPLGPASKVFQPDVFAPGKGMNPSTRGEMPAFAKESSSSALNLNPGPVTESWAPSADLTLHMPKASISAGPENAAAVSANRPSSDVASEASTTSMQGENRSAIQAPSLSVPEVADKVYRLLERRLVIERERRGIFRL